MYRTFRHGCASQKSRVKLIISLSVIIPSVAVAVIIIFIIPNIGDISVTLSDDSVVIDASMMDRTVAYSDITLVELRNGLDYGESISGLKSPKVLTGRFRNTEFGEYDIAIHRSVGEVIVLHTVDRTLVFNMPDVDSTVETYLEILSRVYPGTSGTASPMTDRMYAYA